MNKYQRENWPDIAKGIGILLVVYGHVTIGLFNAGIPMDPEWFKRIDAFIYAFHMPLFFWVSGYLYFYSIQKKSTLLVLRDKTKIVLYLYVVWSVLHGLVEVVMSKYTRSPLGFVDVFALFRPRQHFWFLYVLFLVFLLSTLIYQFKNQWVVLGALAAAILLYHYFGALGNWYPLIRIAPWFVYFAAGVAMAQFKVVLFNQTGWLWLVILGALAFGSGLPVVIACLGVATVLAISRWIDENFFVSAKSALIYLGQVSLPIYLIHVLSGSGIRIVLQKFFHVQDFWLHLIAGLFFAVWVPILIHRLSLQFRWNFLWAWPAFQNE